MGLCLFLLISSAKGRAAEWLCLSSAVKISSLCGADPCMAGGAMSVAKTLKAVLPSQIWNESFQFVLPAEQPGEAAPVLRVAVLNSNRLMPDR